jgi:hypothetical protein
LADALRPLAAGALARLAGTRAQRRAVDPAAIPAMVANWTAEPVLTAAARPGFDLYAEQAVESEFRRSFRLMSKVVRAVW